MIGYAKYFESTQTIFFKVTDKKLLKKYTKVWKKVSSLVNTEFDSEPVFSDNDKCITTKIKLYGNEVNANFQGKRVPKEDKSYTCLPLIMLDSVIRVSKKNFPQALLEECQYETKNNKMENLINDDFDLTSADNESDNESNNVSENDEANE